MNRELLTNIIDRLIKNAEGVQYGAATLTIKLHDGRVTETTIAVTQSTKQKVVQND